MTAMVALLGEVARTTGFDPAALPGDGPEVRVAGVGGVGVSTLVEACRLVDPGLPIGEYRPARDGDGSVGVALMVVDPSSSVGEPEQRLVEELRARYGALGVVCTRIDAHWDWPRVLRAHRHTLDPHEQLPMFAVSALAATSGAIEESGVVEVVGWLREHLAAPPDLRRMRARVSAAQGAVAHRIADLETAVETGPDVDELTARRRALVESRDRGRAERLGSLRAGLARARAQSLADLQNATRSMTATAAQRCASLTPAKVSEHVARVGHEAGELQDRMDRVTDERIDEARVATLVGIDTLDPPASDPALGGPGSPIAPMVFGRAVPNGRRGAEDALLVLIGASTGLGVGRLIVAPMQSVQTLQWISMPLTLLLGVAVAAWVIRMRRLAGLRADMRGWTIDAVGEARARIEHRIAARVSAAEPQIAGQVTRHHERRTRRLAAEIADIDERLRRSRSVGTDTERDRRIGEARRLHGELGECAAALAGSDGADA